jgi:DNA-binding SARP family transcriptional activator/TolB-like protein
LPWLQNWTSGYGLRLGELEAPALPWKTRALLAYLAAHPNRPVTREVVAELLWPGKGTEQMGHSLRQALADLRRRIKDHEIIVAYDRELTLADTVITDIDQLAKLTPSSDPGAMRHAATAYAGPLLDGFPAVSPDFDDWLTLTRTRFEHAVLDALARLGDAASAAGQPNEALAAAERMFGIDPLREDGHRRLLLACAAAGRRSEALRHYGAIVDVLKRELDVSPAPETREIARRLRREMAPLADPPDPPAVETVPANPSAFGQPPVAVLPYRQLGGAPLPTHTTEGLIADIVCQLSGLRDLSVISHGSTMGLHGLDIDARAASRVLGARYVVTGTIRHDGHNMRLTTELTDTADSAVIWAYSQDTATTLTFAEQDRVVGRIVNTLAPRVHERELRRIRGKRPDSLTTYDKVLLAREHLDTMDHARLLAAKPLLEQVVAEEPDYGEAHALLADYHGLIAAEGLSRNRESDIAAVDQSTARALSLDPDNIRALVSYAHRKSLLRRDYTGARELFHRALDVSPNHAMAWLWSSLLFSWLGEAEEAVARATRALELSPCDRQANKFYTTMCTAHYTAGNYREAAEWGMRALNKESIMRGSYRFTAAALVAAGDGEQAKEIVRLSMDKLPEQKVSDVVQVSPYRDPQRRQQYGEHLVAAGFPI